MGPRGAGHYVKMVHNGIEYGDMQLIAEVYDLLHRGAGLPARELADIFAEWNDGELQSYLVEITAQIFERTDDGRQAAGRRDPRRGAAEGHRQVDEPECLRHRRADPDGQRRGRGAHPVVAEDRARGRQPGAARPVARGPRRSRPSRRGRAAGALRQQDHVVRAGHGDAADRVEGIRLRHRSGLGRQDLAGRLHHPREPARATSAARSSAIRRSSTCCSTTRSATRSASARTAGGTWCRRRSGSAFRCRR